jgi:RimJ/RimL family protein N-acetyltransferase
MREPIIEDAIVARPLIASDVDERYLSWFRDEKVVRFLESRNLSRDEVIAFMEAGRDAHRFMDAICLRESGLHIGNVKIDVNWKHSSADLSILIGDRAHWNKGHATSAIRAMTRRAFEILRLRKLTAGIYAMNLGSLKCFERANWRLDAIQRDQLLFDGKPVDRIVMAAFNPGDWTTKPPLTPAV